MDSTFSIGSPSIDGHSTNSPSIDVTSISRGTASDEALFETIAEAILQRGLVIIPGLMPPEITSGLLRQFAEPEATDFHRAAVGRGQTQTVNSFIRRDRIAWIDESNVQVAPWLDWTEALRAYLNRRLFLGLFSFESHLAVYEPGAFYKRHVDAFRGDASRVLSVVTYLNEGWAPDQGGELVLFEKQPAREGETGEEEREIRVTPEMGTLVLFLSEEFPHEVLPAHRTRYSVAGWYRLNSAAAPEQIDPPR